MAAMMGTTRFPSYINKKRDQRELTYAEFTRNKTTHVYATKNPNIPANRNVQKLYI